MSASWAETTRRVIARANGRCEYGLMHQSLRGATFHIEHIDPRSSGGTDDESNLALACLSCNLGKSNRRAAPIRTLPESPYCSIRARIAGRTTFDGTGIAYSA